MNITKQLAKHLREVHFGGNWTGSNLRDTLDGVTWQQATTQVNAQNTIVTLVYHINYFVAAALPVLQGQPLTAHDKYSFDHPPIHSQESWENFLQKVWADAEMLAGLIEQLPDEQLWEAFADEKYGDYYRNLQGTIEHTHYHLGQIAIIKKMAQQVGEN